MDIKIVSQYKSDNCALYCADTVEAIKMFNDNSMDMELYSPPFSSLYTFSNSDRDLSNCTTDEIFFEHFDYVVKDLYRILKPGRIMAVHCTNITTSKEHDGYIGIKDFRGDLIRLFQKNGFIYHSEVCIWKSAALAMQRTKAIGLLHKQLKKDSTISRMALPDYIVFMRKPGENAVPVIHTNESYPVSKWANVASPIWDMESPVWMDINQSKTLSRNFYDEESERHIAPTQLETLERCIELYSNEGEVIFTPFLGIGSEVYQAVKMGRKGIGIELKEVYFEQAVKNIQALEEEKKQLSLFDLLSDNTVS